ncbi:hypothetical protein [Ferruginibacter sp.]
MKKFFSWLGTIIIIAVIVAAFTAPGKEQCNQYMAKKMKPETHSSLTVSETPFKLLGIKIFSFYSVSYIVPLNISVAGQTGTATPAAFKAATMTNETYLGLYNSFWKIQ